MTKPQFIHVVTIEHKHGADIAAFTTAEKAEDYAIKWADRHDRSPRRPRTNQQHVPQMGSSIRVARVEVME